MYANWNNCVRRARGQYVYMATSDDTMAPDCLERLVDGLERHPECGLAHASLRVIDELGREVGPRETHERIFFESSGPLADRRHVRMAPFDGLLHLSGNTVFTSMTQLLIRRTLFDQIGYFDGQWGSVGDFNWGMRAGLVTNTLHVPETWGGWRLHEAQATAAVVRDSRDYELKVRQMVSAALERLGGTDRAIASWVREHAVAEAESLRDFQGAIKRIQAPGARWAFVLRHLLAGEESARTHLVSKYMSHEPMWPAVCRRWAAALGVVDVLRALPTV